MIIDSVNLSTVGLIPGRRGASRSGPRVVDPFATIPGANQAVRLGRGVMEPKTIILTGHITGDTVSELQDNIDKVKWYLRPLDDGSTHILRWSDDSTVEWLVNYGEVIIRGIDPEWITPAVQVEVSLSAADPRGRNPSEQTVNNAGALPNILTPSAIGSAPMPVTITITGNSVANVTALTIQYRDSSNTVLSSFSWAGTALTGSDTLVINTGTAVVERNGSNDVSSITDANGALPFDMDPSDGDFITQALPDINVTGTGTCDVCRLTYRERYW